MVSRRPLPVLVQGDGWLVVAKPPSLLVHRNDMARREYAALQRVRDMVGRRVHPIHRLDRAASGCLLFATRRELAGPLSASLNAADSTKTYVAFVRGYFKADGPVQVDTPMKDSRGVLKQASSVVTCLGRTHEPRSSLLRVVPATGRYHQVRRHVRDLHHPVIRDHEHGDSRVNAWWRDEYGVARLGLHALRLELTLPWGEPLRVVSPLFRDQAALFRRLPWWEDALAAQPELGLPPLPLLDEVPSAEADVPPTDPQG